VNDDREEFWATVPDKADHPRRVLLLEALRCIGEPISALTAVDVLDGDMSMWEASYGLTVLERLGIVETTSTDMGRGTTGEERFDVPYRLKSWKSDKGR